VKELTEIKVLSGSRSIGGNFIRIEDGDRIIIFDQGIRFDVMSNYYSSFITPRGTSELRELGVLPKAEWYENATDIYISHLHLDHLGALSNIPSEAIVHLPSLTVYEDMEERWSKSSTWLSLVPRKYFIRLEETKPLETDKNNVMAIPLSHSAYPACALLYFGRDETILYTGDFRVESFLNKDEFTELNEGEDLLSFLNENTDIRVDSLIIEGTNIGSDRLPLSPKEATETMRKIVTNQRPIIATLHNLDIEYAYTLMKICAESSLDLYIASTQTTKLLEKKPQKPVKPILIEEYVDYLTPLEKVSVADVEEESLIIVPYREIIDFLRDIEQVRKGFLYQAVAIISEPEPEIEEASECTVIANWLSKIGIQFYRIRASGHYYPYQLKTILNAIKPKKKIEGIHTKNLKLLHSLSGA